MTPPGAALPPPGRTGWQRGRKWIGLAILLAGLGYLVLRLLEAQPVAVEVQYRYGAARAGLQQATMRYHRLAGTAPGDAPDAAEQGEELRRVTFRYGRAAPPRIQRHRILVQEGEYRVSIELRYPGRAPAGLGGRRASAPGGGERVELRRLLIVGGADAVSIELGPRAPGGA